MFKLWASIKKDGRILVRDKMGLTLMFLMPIVLAIVITLVQNSTFELVNDKKVPLLIVSRDTGAAAKVLETTLEKGGMFILKKLPAATTDAAVKERMQQKEALLGIIIPQTYTTSVLAKAAHVADQALQNVSLSAADTITAPTADAPITLFYHPVLQPSFRSGIDGALHSVLQIVQSKYIVRQLYSRINDAAPIPDTLEKQIVSNEMPIVQLPASKDNSVAVPNAIQHNIPAWTVFAMFFIVISLGSSIVREKASGSFVRLKTMPTPVAMAIFSKQITYIVITLLQALVIFSIGKWLFPFMGMAALQLPADKAGLLLVVLICGWCATSFAICIGIFANTQEQSNGVGAIAIILFAAIGGLLVPAFAMPESFHTLMRISPLHWCLEAFYGLFLEGGKLKDIFSSVLPLLIITGIFQAAAWVGMKRQQLL